ncbi:hypothetical protein CCHR01_19178 [Colletotrichum chrysophilum]|uniref:Uncharacterized protein n=1 Tax=Colletotrichum chrysophilum TaxID=1836956 RepID=A0AAD8ZYY8_9PEZI|nr:hypothetical protein CCHR01_19178 [Colletotrichum chrysophilum]
MVEDEEKDSVEERTARTKTWTGVGWRREKRAPGAKAAAWSSWANQTASRAVSGGGVWALRTEEDQTPVRPQGGVESDVSLGWYATGFTGFTECMGWRVAEGKEREWRFGEIPRTLLPQFLVKTPAVGYKTRPGTQTAPGQRVPGPLLGSPSRCSRRTKLGYSGADEKERREHSPGIKH